MRTIIIPLIIFIGTYFTTYSQTTYTLADTVIGNRLLKAGNELFGRRQFDSALVKVDSAFLIFEQVFGVASEHVVSTLYLKSFVLHNLGKKDDATAITEKIITIQVKRFGEMSLQAVQAHERLANIYADFDVYKKAIPIYEKVISIRLKLSNESL